ncbi:MULTISPECIES: SMC-Scp complex subunit ScpB [Nitrosomonas]|uniref:Condensin subunit ScpB n=2 Tax=Nitrosomonas eutropha TaxID=916 RepID=A0ABX5MAZ9_9PROT|nr:MULTISPECIES: SMC-Scp complex subunit ScpB [Nitrosomonas]ABI60267.1 condensin subunit ScpB [Nitrosomonas eutropha C91]MXS80638.1 SMC-Scp complex subunit ScpB [Nitrosomonas sp. GH22]PXV81692.1 condensin subunit ScpB [Nitrosomonas eutropha]SCX11841.1 condensin subunit ScpB [Nitrosomonas eutropha]SDW73464.1 condensin subunit ScpB [Nitrosomonas eutropha]
MSTPAILTEPIEANLVLSLNDQVVRVVEAALLTTSEPLTINDLKKLFEGNIDKKMLHESLTILDEKWCNSGIELVLVAGGWRFQSKPEMQIFLDRLNPQRPPRYSRAVMETLAIIAYRQPVTRGDIEEIRGVAVSTQVIKTLESRGWIETIGQREIPGKPYLYATTRHFLDDLNLQSLEQLPSLENFNSLNISAEEKLNDQRIDQESGESSIHESI